MVERTKPPRIESAEKQNVGTDLSTFRTATARVDFDELLGLPDEVHQAVASRRRRTILQYLHESGGRASVTQLAGRIAADELGTVDRATSDYQQRIITSLYHTHLPTLVDLGYVRWTATGNEVALTTPAN